MPTRVTRRRPDPRPAYQPSILGTTTPTLRRVNPARRAAAGTDETARNAGEKAATSARPATVRVPASLVVPSSRGVRVREDREDTSGAVYERLAAEREALLDAGPGVWLQRSIDRAADGDAVVALLQAYDATRCDVANIEAELLRRPLSLQTANRWMLRMRTVDVDRAVAAMCEVKAAKVVSETDNTPYTRRALGQIPMAGLRIVHRGLRSATHIDLSRKGLTDTHLQALLPLLRNFDGMRWLDLSGNAITDAHMALLGTELQNHVAICALDLSGNAVTFTGVNAFNGASLSAGPALIMTGDLQARNTALPAFAGPDGTPEHAAFEAADTASRARQDAAFEIHFGLALRISLSRAKTGADVVRALATEPGTLRRMRTLDLSDKRWTQDDLTQLANVLQRDGGALEDIVLSDSRLPEGGIRMLSDALRHAPRLQTVRLRNVAAPTASDARVLAALQPHRGVTAGTKTYTPDARAANAATDAGMNQPLTVLQQQVIRALRGA